MATSAPQPPASLDSSLRDKVAIVSASDSGIGAQIARELSSCACTVVINYPFPDAALESRAEAVLASLPYPNQGIAVEADLSTIDGPKKLVDEAVAKYGKIDILVNNAGLAINLPFEEQTLEHWDQLVNLNGRGTFLLTQAVLPHLSRRDSRIINICSISARDAPPMQTIYAGTKGMVDSFTKVWAKELPRTYGCTVNSVSPGPTRTEGFAAAGEDMMKILGPIIDTTPVGSRMGESAEIGYAVLMLALPKASWLNGVHLVASGGLFMT